MNIRQTIKQLPILGPMVDGIYQQWLKLTFSGSRDYWENRYARGGGSGDGSRRQLAIYKAEIINDFVRQKGIRTVVEYGCGDGYQLQLADYPSYIGFDVSRHAISRCREIFADDPAKSFKLTDAYDGEMAELTLSLDVIFHLVEDAVFDGYMKRLFDSSRRFVIIYSSDSDVPPDPQGLHVKHRKFSVWVDHNQRDWKLLAHIPNRYPYSGDTEAGSFSDFHIYGKT